MSVDDAGGPGVQGRRCVQVRLQLRELCGADHFDIFHAIGLGAFEQGLQRGLLLARGCDHKLAAAPVRNAPLGAIAVERPAALYAEPGAQAARGVVETGVDDFTVA